MADSKPLRQTTFENQGSEVSMAEPKQSSETGELDATSFGEKCITRCSTGSLHDLSAEASPRVDEKGYVDISLQWKDHDAANGTLYRIYTRSLNGHFHDEGYAPDSNFTIEWKHFWTDYEITVESLALPENSIRTEFHTGPGGESTPGISSKHFRDNPESLRTVISCR